MSIKVPFNKPYLAGNELQHIESAIKSGKISGNGKFTFLCHRFFEDRYNFKKCFLTSSCTDALEMAALLLEISPGDEVIMPAFTFVSTANAFVLRGAKIIFCDSRIDHPGMDESKLKQLITERTKAIVVVHYAGVACNMDSIMKLANHYNLFVVEDAAHSIDSYYINSAGKKVALGSIGHLSTFSFHETKNIISGEGGMLVVNDERFKKRAEIIWEKGTNRSAFFRGEVDKYNWVDVGSSFLPSEVTAAFLWGQLENLDRIQNRRLELWNKYYNCLSEISECGDFKLPIIPKYATNNAHIFYFVCSTPKKRSKIIAKLKANGILAVFHYISLHTSPYYKSKGNDNLDLKNSQIYTDRLLRLPLFYELEPGIIDQISNLINETV
ncbi:dTDP-4-amino-4,6-dideoxygalactose transaminase [Christiangramia aquimixticola]|uniref:dTDP-4-amino-4,6-dideoxygalactose transaminase n=1 Tax=Christiangramia aquimixticola TaxID=1697558 RepID=UPI003AA8E148